MSDKESSKEKTNRRFSRKWQVLVEDATPGRSRRVHLMTPCSYDATDLTNHKSASPRRQGNLEELAVGSSEASSVGLSLRYWYRNKSRSGDTLNHIFAEMRTIWVLVVSLCEAQCKRCSSGTAARQDEKTRDGPLYFFTR